MDLEKFLPDHFYVRISFNFGRTMKLEIDNI